MEKPTAQQILKAARNKHNLTQVQLSLMLSVSVDQIKRMESGKWIPEMSDVDLLEEQLQEPGLFRKWARAQYPEIEKYFGSDDERNYGLLGAIVNTRHQIGDVLGMNEAIERDVLDGRIENTMLMDKYKQELKEARMAIDTALEKLQGVR